MKRIVYFLGLTFLTVSLLFATKPISFNLDPYNPEYDPNTILVKFHDEAQVNNSLAKTALKTGIVSVDRLIGNYSVRSVEKVFVSAQPVFGKRTFIDPSGKEHELKNMDKIYRIKYNANKDPKELSEDIANDPSVDYAEPDYYIYAMIAPDDPFYTSGDQWHIDAVNAPAAWDSTTADTNQVISIIDTGVDWDHPDLDNNIWINRAEAGGIEGIDDDGNGYVDDIRGWDFINDDNDPDDDNSHGTHVAGIVGAETNNAVGVAGIAPNARIMPIKVLQSSGSGNSSDLAAGIDYAALNGATVINMSLGSYGESQTVKTALENAYAYAVLVAAAGNNGYKVDPPFPPQPIYAPMYPACYGFVLGVEASMQTDIIAGFSNYDPSGPIEVWNSNNHNYEVRAPGVEIYSTFPDGNYRDLSGTSMASPIVAGAVALMKTFNPAQSTEQIFARLIQSSSSGVLDIENALDYELEPILAYLDYTIVDTLPGCDGDGIADAGETIELYISIKNAGGQADSVWSKLRFGEFEDESVATIVDSTSQIGDISAYAQMTGETDPFIIEIASDVANNRDIVFEYEVGLKDYSSIENSLVINIQNGIELSGVISSDRILYPNQFYIVKNHLAIIEGVTLTLRPGTTLLINDDLNIVIGGKFEAIGTPDSLITIKNNQNNWGAFDIQGVLELEYCILEGAGRGQDMFKTQYSGPVSSVKNCILRYNEADGFYTNSNVISMQSCNIYDNILNAGITGASLGSYSNGRYFNYNNVTSNTNGGSCWYDGFIVSNSDYLGRKNNIFSNTTYDFALYVNTLRMVDIAPNYWGMTDSADINQTMIDFYEVGTGGIADYSDYLSAPSDSTHGIIWKIEINDILINKHDNPYNDPSGLGIVGSETLKFDVYFNRAMDTTVTPFLSFGVREPYTQHIVTDSASWSSDSTVWTAYHTIELGTGDGDQRVRVALAEDTDHFVIPTEDQRFEFVIQAASAEGVQFYANAGIGKVNLSWAKAPANRELGYNVYRYMDGEYPTKINEGLITGQTYIDYDVIPDSSYYYRFTVLGTDMEESDLSKVVTATVLSAANGDANGDQNVNVLDVISMVNYILGGDPNPFLFDAADVNGDGNINVLDIIGVVNIILNPGMGKAAFADATESVFYLKDNKVHASANGALGGYQFIIHGDIEELNISSTYPMEVATTKLNDQTLMIMVYSLTGNMIPKGDNIILELSDADNLTFTDLVVADTKGGCVPCSFGSFTDIVIPVEFALNQNYPNPFNAGTVISYELPEIADVELVIYNLLGQKVYGMYVADQRAGYYKYHWNGLDPSGNSLPSGVYVYKIIAGEFTDSKKMILMK